MQGVLRNQIKFRVPQKQKLNTLHTFQNQGGTLHKKKWGGDTAHNTTNYSESGGDTAQENVLRCSHWGGDTAQNSK